MQVDPTLPITLEKISAPGSRTVVPATAQRAGNTRSTGAHREETERALAELSQAVAPFNIALKFSKDHETGTIVVQMIDQKSGETLQQIPNEVSLHVAACLSKWQGRILNRQA